MKKLYTLIILSSVTFFLSCKKEFLDINTDPNNPSVAEIGLLLPSTQVAITTGLTSNLSDAAAAFADQTHSATWGRWLQNNGDFNDDWKSMYSGALPDIELIISSATASGARGFVGIAKIEKAYMFSVLVDLFGDVPYFEAGKSQNAKFDNGELIYNEVFTLLEEGIATLSASSKSALPIDKVAATSDIIYKGDQVKWLKFARSLKLKLYNQIRLYNPQLAKDSIMSLIKTPTTLIALNSEDGQFQFGGTSNPPTGHPLWFRNYTGGKSGLLSNFFIHKLVYGNTTNMKDPSVYPAEVRYDVKDPRTRYYFFRQYISGPIAASALPCDYNNVVTCKYGYQGQGYLGRDRGDNSVGPADGALRSTYGIYPVGGLFDSDVAKAVGSTDGKGSGIFPFMTNFGVSFIRAEAALTLATGEDPKKLLESGIRASIQKVIDFGTANGSVAAALIPSAADITTYVNAVLAKYDGAADDTQKLEIIIDQSHTAWYGNGVEAYNNLRRTGFPVLMPPTNPSRSDVPLRVILPIAETAANANAPKGDLTNTPVFWDK